jgi:hypothetical protein
MVPAGLNDESIDNILLRLDEYNIGTFSVAMIADFAGTASFIATLGSYTTRSETKSANANTPGLSTNVLDDSVEMSSDILGLTSNTTLCQNSIPLLVWVDDIPQHNRYFRLVARDIGVIPVLEFLSTAEAKMWIDENLGP